MQELAKAMPLFGALVRLDVTTPAAASRQHNHSRIWKEVVGDWLELADEQTGYRLLCVRRFEQINRSSGWCWYRRKWWIDYQSDQRG